VAEIWNYFREQWKDYEVTTRLKEKNKFINFSEDLAVIAKRDFQFKLCTAIDETLQMLKHSVLNEWPDSKNHWEP